MIAASVVKTVVVPTTTLRVVCLSSSVMVRGTLPRRLSSRAATAACVYTLLLTLVTGVRSQGKYSATRKLLLLL